MAYNTIIQQSYGTAPENSNYSSSLGYKPLQKYVSGKTMSVSISQRNMTLGKIQNNVRPQVFFDPTTLINNQLI